MPPLLAQLLANAPPCVAAPSRFAGAMPHLRDRFARVDNFLVNDLAESAYDDLQRRIEYEREKIVDRTRMWRARVSSDGGLITRDRQEPTNLLLVCNLIASDWFAAFVSHVADETVACLEPPKICRMRYGDRIMVHEDNHHPSYRFGVTLHFAKHWARQCGGAFVIGPIAHRRRLATPPGFPLPLYARAFGASRSVLLPHFNSLVVFPLTGGLGHGVTPVQCHRDRFAIVCLFGDPDKRSGDIRKFRYSLPNIVT